MFQSFFNSLSGMFSFSKNLDNVSNNIANMNTPGFRGTDTFLRSVNGDGSGLGTNIEGTSIRMANGEIRQTGNATDLAINGMGMFVLRNENGEYFYSRAGQFQFDENNVLIDSVTEMQVMGINESGNLEPIDITDLRILPPVATSTVQFSGNLSSADSEASVSDISIYDVAGESHDLRVEFANNDAVSPNSWLVEIYDENDNLVGSGEIRFNLDGSPQTGFNTIVVTPTFSGQSQTVTLNFGEPDSFANTTQFSAGSSTIGGSADDGNGVLGLTGIKFKSDGILEMTYSNGETEQGQQLALARFSDESKLKASDGSLFITGAELQPELSTPEENGLGEIVGGSIELSNVDLTQEFADILIIQRGYQASSRVMSVANELLEQLYSSSRG